MDTFFDRTDASKDTAPLQGLAGHAAKVLFALGLVLAAAFALADTEILMAQASNLSNSDLVTILSATEGW
jgi:hypothetical protein